MPPRPVKHTPETVIAALTETKGMVYLAARKLGCDPSGIYKLIKRSAAVRDAWEAIKGETVDTVELKLWQRIMADDLAAITFYLKTKGKDRGYSERMEVTGANGGAQVIQLTWNDNADVDDSPS